MPDTAAQPFNPVVLPGTTPDERPARRTLLDQVARLEDELSQLFCSTWPRKGFEWSVRRAVARACSRSPSSRRCVTTWPSG